MPVRLIFGQPRHSGGPVHLVFGAGPGVVVPNPLQVTVTVQLDEPTVSGLVTYDNRNPRRAGTSATAPHQVAQRADLQNRMPHGLSARAELPALTPWAPARPAQAAPASGWGTPARATSERAALWALANPVGERWALVHQQSGRVQQQTVAPWELPETVAQAWALVHQQAAIRRAQAVATWQLSTPAAVVARALYGAGRNLARTAIAPWQVARAAPPGLSVFVPVTPGGITPHTPTTHLVFACPPWLGGRVHLVFGHVCAAPAGPTAPLFILPARYYMAVHSLTAQRLPDLTTIPIFDLSLSADVGSFGWTFSASAPVSAFEALAPVSGLPAQVRFTLDGLVFTFVVDSLQREEAFGRRSVRFAGRSATALLARPYAREASRTNADAATAQQLAEAALEFTGVTLDWGLTDWLVPAGAWSHTGTPLAAVQAVVEAAGGYLQSHRSAATLLARHPYPELAGGLPGGPWNWYAPGVTPDVQLATDALVTNSIERRDGPDINAVYVSGTTQGVLALVQRAGSAADKLASLITDPLINTQEVALQRGLSVLGAAGPKHLVQFSLPVLTGPSQPGVLDVGQLVEVNASSPWRGRVRGVSVSAGHGREVRQSVKIERHLEVA
jgi:hypothetical protein